VLLLSCSGDGVVAFERQVAVEKAALQQHEGDSHIGQANARAIERVSIKLYDHIERRICPAGAFNALPRLGNRGSW